MDNNNFDGNNNVNETVNNNVEGGYTNEYNADYNNAYNSVNGPYNVQPEESKGMSIASLVLGILSVLGCCIYYISVPMAIVAIVLGVIGRKKGGKGMGTAGMILGIVSIVLTAALYIVVIVGFMNNPEFMSQYQEIMNQYQ